jgi:hypothetical protein
MATRSAVTLGDQPLITGTRRRDAADRVVPQDLTLRVIEPSPAA